MRQATLNAIVGGSGPTSADVVSILDGLLEERATLTRRLLGQPPGGESSPTRPMETMARAFVASGLRMPPDIYPEP